MTRRPDGRRFAALAALLACAGVLPAQQPAAPTTFAAPDGTRFVLVPDPDAAQVQWAIATPADPVDEPPGLEGLAAVVVQASLSGTWRTGSVDAARERAALAALEKAWQDLFAKPGDPQGMQRVQECERAARDLADTAAFERALAELPAHRPEVVAEDGVTILVLTTLPEAIGAVAGRLVERREEQALRDLGAVFVKQVAARQNLYDADPAGAVHAELLALALPNQPTTRAAVRPAGGMPTRAQALQVWQTTQRPERTVHVLTGPIDVPRARAALMQAFAATSLPPWTPPGGLPPQPLQSLRRSTVTSPGTPRLAFGWVLPPDLDPVVLTAAARWLADGADSVLGRALAKAGHPGATVRVRAPWPPTTGGRGLLLVDVADAAGVADLDDVVLRTCRREFAGVPTPAELQAVRDAQGREWTKVLDDPRWLARELALAAVRWPSQPPRLAPPAPPKPELVTQLLALVFAGQPVVVEGHR